MNTAQAYDIWATQYDSNTNLTRDLEGDALRICLGSFSFNNCLEIGCGTGKNTVWLIDKAQHISAIDLSEEMLEHAKRKISDEKVQFKQADITKDWTFRDGLYDLVTFSLVLEHIEHLDPVFKEVAAALHAGGLVYIGELHPFKQYSGSKARFETGDGQQVVQCFNHHVSDFVQTAKKYGLLVIDINEYFDDNNHDGIPRILTMLFRKG